VDGVRRLAAAVSAGVILLACGGSDAPTPLFGGPVTHPFEGAADVRQEGELLVFEDCVVLSGNSGQSAIYLARGYTVIGPVERATIIDPTGTAVATSGDWIYIDGSTIEGDDGIPCDPDRTITSALIAGALGTCTPDECVDD